MSIARASFANGLRVGVFITLVGPLIGAVVFLIGLGSLNGFGFSEGSDGSSALGNALQLGYSVLVFGVIFGAMPALLSGIIVGVITARRGGFSNLTAIGVALAGALALPVISFFASRGEPGTEDAAFFGSLSIFYGLIAVISVIAALACRWLLMRLGWIASTAA